MKKTTLLAATVITTSLTPLISANAAPGHAHNHLHSHEEKKEIKIPETRETLWQALQKEHAALLEAIEAKNAETVHHVEEKLQAYLKALPGKVADLEEGVRKRIEGQARNLARVYDNVHHAADDKTWDRAFAEMKKAEGAMKLLAAQWPK